MVKWIYNSVFLERKELLFIICVLLIIAIIVATIFMVRSELRKLYHANK